MKESNFSPQDSLKLIQDMIDKTRQNMGDNSNQFLLWGWVSFAACIGEFLLKNVFHFEQHYLVWLLMFPAALASILMSKKQQRKAVAVTYLGESMQHLWIGMGISFFVLAMILARLGAGTGTGVFPFYILLYGLGTFVTGKFLQFKPFVWGGLAAWVLAITSTFFGASYQMLFGGAAILISYIIPAYLIRRKNTTIS